ncbi:hypothetical protein ACFQZ2_24625, partial [Streptomonospora algeriensis]
MRTDRLGASDVEATEPGFGGGPLGGLFHPRDDATAATHKAAATPGPISAVGPPVPHRPGTRQHAKALETTGGNGPAPHPPGSIHPLPGAGGVDAPPPGNKPHGRR